MASRANPTSTSSVRRSAGVALMVAACIVVTASLAVTTPACTISGCDGKSVFLDGRSAYDGDFGASHEPIPSTASMLDDRTWQSASLTDAWHPFPPQYSLRFVPGLPGSTVSRFTGFATDVEVKVSPDAQPNSTGNFTPGVGNIAEMGFLGPDGSVAVHNDTCATYYIRVVIHGNPIGPVDAVSLAGDPDVASAVGLGPIDSGVPEASAAAPNPSRPAGGS